MPYKVWHYSTDSLTDKCWYHCDKPKVPDRRKFEQALALVDHDDHDDHGAKLTLINI